MQDVVAVASSPEDYEAFGVLVREYADWLLGRHSDHPGLVVMTLSHQSLDTELADLATAYGPPTGKVLLATRDGEVRGGVAYRTLGAGICEMKRMFVPDRFRGGGTGRRLVEAVLAHARADGFSLMRLDTSILLHEATALYRAIGFVECEAYVDYPAAVRPFIVFMEKKLDSVGGSSTTTSSAAAWEKAAMEAGVQAVIYGLPLVMMDLTMKRSTNVKRPFGIAAPVNQFAHAPSFPTATFKNVVRANVDTLYSSAFLDLSSEPLILSVPDTGGRYYLLPMLDAWTNVFATPGARTTGTKAGTFAVTGPNWTGTLPAEVQEIKSPTNMVWILGRTQTNGPQDYPTVHEIQAGFNLIPLSLFGKPYAAPEGVVDPTAEMRTPPVEQLQHMTGIEFFTVLARLLRSTPPPAADAPALQNLATIGVIPGQPFDPGKIDPTVAKALEGVVPAAIAALQEKAKQMGTAVHGWRIPKMNIGAFGTDYDTRAFIALIALGANLPADSLYPTSFVDEDGKLLDGTNRYVLHFDAGLTPPVNAFWSVTMYDPHSFFVDNPINRYAISSWMPLRRNEDGSVDIYIQHSSPGTENEANWLPAPDGGFNLTMRMYWPKDLSPSIIDGSWMPPAVRRLP